MLRIALNGSKIKIIPKSFSFKRRCSTNQPLSRFIVSPARYF
nr:MAG TPA: hypothetical protein [Caudoviricetes sp.]